MSMFRYTPATLKKMELLLKELGFLLRYEKGQFQSGHCLLEEKRVIVINKFYTLEARINALLDILGQLDVDRSRLDAEQGAFLDLLLLQKQSS
jgi:hypothetical protein